MKAIFNSRIIDTSHPILEINNRAFCYGDGLFETIVTGIGRIDLLNLHFSRLQRSAKALGFSLSGELSFGKLRSHIEKLTELNAIEGLARVRVHVWRDQGGLYSPKADSSSYIIEIESTSKPFIQIKERLGLITDYRNIYSPTSFIKSKSALQYVMVGKLLTEGELDDAVILDHKDHVSETHIANIFWIKDNQIFTPELSTGCVEGVLRSKILEVAKDLEISIKIVSQSHECLAQADSIFSSNAAGVCWFKNFKNTKLDVNHPLINPIIKRLQVL